MKDLIKQLGGIKSIAIGAAVLVVVVVLIMALGSAGGEHGHTH